MDNLWDTKRCAEFVGVSYDHFRKVVKTDAGYPPPLDKPGRPRWNPKDWERWAENLRNPAFSGK